jgi:putative transposase
VKSIKAVRFGYEATPETRQILETFRMMVNHAIHLSLTEGVKGRLKLRDRIYKEFQVRYGVASCYPYSVAEVAWSIVKKHHRWNRAPVARHLMMKIDSDNYSLNHGVLSLPFRKGERLLIPLEYENYQRSFLIDEALKRGSVTMTESGIVIAFSKETEAITPLGRVGIDLNEKSAVISDGTTYDLSKAARLHTEYGVRRRDFSTRHPHDRRLRHKFSSGSREKERVKQFLHEVSKQIVEKAKQSRRAIVLERLKGIRYLHQKGNRESKASRRRIAQWPFRELQRQIEYKAGWDGVQVEYVGAAWTSKKCHLCGFVNRKLKVTEREWLCPCGATLDRDLNAAINIERRGKIACLGEVRPGARGE